MKVWSRVVLVAAIGFALSIATAYAATAPTRVTKLSATAGDQQVTVSWSPPLTGTPPFTYMVTASPGGYSSTDSTTTRTVTNLTNGTLYTFKVFPANSTGGGPGSTVTATPHASPPGPPTNLGATPGPGAGQMTLSWTPPASTGSSPDSSPPTIDHYTVTVSPGGTSQQVNATTTVYLVSNLANNITYTFTVTATNSRSLTGPAATVYAPVPSAATIGLEPTAGGATTDITANGQSFLKNESITLYWDNSSHVAAAVVTDDTGAFTKVVRPFSGDNPGVHKLCASVPPKPCASFTLQGPPTPTPNAPTPADSPSPAGIPPASAIRTGGGGIGGLDVLLKPPFVFLPIIAILGLIGVIAYWALAVRRRPPAPTSATVTHLATRPNYASSFPRSAPAVPPAGSSPAPPQPPAQSAWDAPVVPTAPAAAPPQPSPPQSPAPPEVPPAAPGPPPPPVWPAAPDEPPDLPEPSD
jgi:Fibronectin type III domain